MATTIEQDQYNVFWLTTGTNPLLPYTGTADICVKTDHMLELVSIM